MARGKNVQEGKTLKMFSTKIEPETKATMEALVKVQGLDGQRELIGRMLQLYLKDTDQATLEKVNQYLQLLDMEGVKI